MKRKFLFLCGALVVSACDTALPPQAYYNYRSNTTMTQKSSDLLACRVAAENIVPQKMTVTSDPARTYCSNYGRNVSCSSYGGTVSSYDANSGLRGDVIDQCMSGKGYQRTPVPECPSSVVPDNVVALMGPMVRPPVQGACEVDVGTSSNSVANLLYPSEFKPK